jgi:lysozyme
VGRPMRTSEEGIEFIKRFEGFRAVSVRAPEGGWVIGYGHTKAARENLKTTREDAELILRFRDLPPVEAAIAGRVLMPLSQNEFDALVSFAWNIGLERFLASDVAACLNQGDRLGAVQAMALWRRGMSDGQVRVIDALVRRRAAEIALFLSHESGPVPAPGALLRPQREVAPPPADPADTIVIGPRQLPAEGAPARPPVSGGNPQAAARAVRERMTRILGQEAAPRAPEVPLPPGAPEAPSIEEITQAVSALADPAANGSAERPFRGPPDGVERRRPVRPPEPVAPPHVPPTSYIDDVTPAKPDPDLIRKAIEEDRARRTRQPGSAAAITFIPFALFSGLGLVAFLTGAQRFAAASAGAVLGDGNGYVTALLMVGGGFLFSVSAYYLFRALAERR